MKSDSRNYTLSLTSSHIELQLSFNVDFAEDYTLPLTNQCEVFRIRCKIVILQPNNRVVAGKLIRSIEL